MTTLLQKACSNFLQEQEALNTPTLTRGRDYHANGLVQIVQQDDLHAMALVAGTDNYVVALSADSGVLHTNCNCPVGQRDPYCKHAVAVALAVTLGATQAAMQAAMQTKAPARKPGKSAPAKPAAKAPAENPLPAVIEQLDTAILRKLLGEAAENDRRLRDRILLISAARRGPDEMASQWKTGMKNACAVRGFVDWRRMGELARGIDAQLNVLDDWLNAGQAVLVVSLAEYAADRVETLIGKVDDSDGSIAYLLTRIGEQHQRACAQARPEPRELAKRLFKRECDGKWDTFRDAVVRYADVLGESGIAVYRRLAEAAWAKVTPLKPGQMESRHDHDRFTITRIMEKLAHLDGDVDALVQVYSRDLSMPYCYLKISEALLEAGRAKDALQWAETGHKAFATGRRDERLTTFIVHRYLADGLVEDALRLANQLFDQHPVPQNWALLKSVAEQHGSWPSLRATLLANLRARLEAGNTRVRALHGGHDPGPNRSMLVELLLADGDEETAWQEANLGHCHEGVWLVLARQREEKHPADSIAIYQRLATDALHQTGKSYYKRAMQHIVPAVRLLKTSQGAAAAGRYLESLRETYRRRTAFVEMLDKLGGQSG